MNDKFPVELPEITDDDIRWVSALLKLKEPFDEPRQKAIKSLGTVDIAACPGSGKTTLLVAKLAILAKKWPFQTQGLCVLSHTNVACNEIESRLGNTAVGRRLLSYPHFLGTIHGFVNDFLAMPWLRSKGNLLKVIDSDICEARRWSKLSNGSRFALQQRKIHQSDICILNARFNLARKNSAFPFAETTPTYKDFQKACQATYAEGYHCFDDMFIWGNELLDGCPNLVAVLRSRFPYLLIDEAQDYSEEQAAILHRIFAAGDNPVIRQRFGDGNQAIYHSMNAKEVTEETYKFPTTQIIDLPNSYRFGQEIAQLADPLSLDPHENGLKGQRSLEPLESGAVVGQHTIFLFEKDSVGRVLDTYAELLLQTFSENELASGTFTAVGQVHRPRDEESWEKFPRHVKDYWNAYDPQITKPSTFVHYILAGQEKAAANNLTLPVVELIADAIFRLVKTKSRVIRPQRHRQILERLKELDIQRKHPGILLAYEELVFRFAVKRETLTKAILEDECRKTVTKIAEAIAGERLSERDAEEFLSWPSGLDESGNHQATGLSRNNIYIYPRDNPKVQIRLGSIHSVKGQTHTATLVLETFWQDRHKPPKHNLELLLSWLCSDQSGCDHKQNGYQRTRLKLHYVAMTRPTHLLCLAMKQDSVTDGYREKLRKRGWNFVEVF